MKKRLLIISPDQFGYLTDILKYCQYASDRFHITYIGWDYNKPRISVKNVNIIYISRKSNKIARYTRLLNAFHQELKKKYDIVFASYMRGVSILKLLHPRQRFIVDIRTLSVNPNLVARIIYNTMLWIETRAFKRISVIHSEIAKQLKIKSYSLLPLGGECYSKNKKTFDQINLLYVGTLEGRNILDCVKGVHLFLKNSTFKDLNLHFTIVGDSSGNELTEIKEYIQLHSLQQSVETVGAVPNTKLTPFFEKSNIGVAYIPLHPYYKFQPPTKTFEYLLSGLPVIATDTEANRMILKETDGVLIKDNVDSFVEGLKEIINRSRTFDSSVIKKNYTEFNWINIVNQRLLPLLFN